MNGDEIDGDGEATQVLEADAQKVVVESFSVSSWGYRPKSGKFGLGSGPSVVDAVTLYSATRDLRDH